MTVRHNPNELNRGSPIFPFKGGWARLPGYNSHAAHHWDRADDHWRSSCGKIKRPLTSTAYEVGGFHKCLQCGGVLLVRAAREND